MGKEKKVTVSIGEQSFEKIRGAHTLYIDKTDFIKQWWEGQDSVTLITRPRRFGKTLNMNMLECFFSDKYAGRADLFEGLSIWKEASYRQLQGTYPVIFMSFAPVKTGDINEIKALIKRIISNAARRFSDVLKSEIFDDNDKAYIEEVNPMMSDAAAYMAVSNLCILLEKYYHKKAIILLDEYDTPMQEAWLSGSWGEAVSFFRSFFNATFKANPHMERGIITGITRISKESIFSDLNNLKVITVTSEEYATCFGFTESEVFQALDDAGMGDEKAEVKNWYNGFTFGNHTDIYNPWSITSFIDEGAEYKAYWVDTSGNGLVNSLIQKGSANVKQIMEELISGGSFEAEIDEQVVFNQLDGNENAIWSLLLAAGYLKVLKIESVGRLRKKRYTLALTNLEVEIMFAGMISRWFNRASTAYNDFVKALLLDDVDSMNEFMNRIAAQSFSSFDTAKNASSEDAPERLASCCDCKGAANGSSLCFSANLQREADASQFYHGFVLRLIVGLEGRFAITSNRESGFGRYDVMLEPINPDKDNAYIIEFKVHKPSKENTIAETAANALAQIEQKNYEAALTAKGIRPGHIKKYGFAFEGKKCLIIE